MHNSSTYQKLSNKDFKSHVIVDRQSAVLVFGAKWSGNSEIMDSMMERVSSEYDSSINFFRIDIEDQLEISEFFNIYYVPTIVLIKNGEIKDMIRSFIAASKIRKKINDIFLSDPKDN